MVTDDVEAAAALWPPQGPLIGLDLGTKTLGLAVSDGLRLSANPLETLRRRKFTQDAEQLEAVIAARGVGGVVLGLPRNMEGDEGPRAQSTRAFARNLSNRPGFAEAIPAILLWDERLSTVAVERTLLEADASRLRRAAVIDKLAAAYILQGALERLRHLRGAPDQADEL
ncbi:MAG: Holliday junction resolvase RuvX [Pseudomonadota bacterium]